MKALIEKKAKRIRRKAAIRSRVHGTPTRPRLSVFRSHSNIYAQLINDSTGRTLVSANSKIAAGVAGKKVDLAKHVGIALAQAAKKAGISAASFDRGGFRYHGRVKALAEGAREGGLKF